MNKHTLGENLKCERIGSGSDYKIVITNADHGTHRATTHDPVIADLIMEANQVATKTGLTPRQLVEAAVKSKAYLGGAYLGGAKDVICAGIPKNYWFHGWHKDGVLMIRGGCHSFTITEAREYWSGKDERKEIILALDYIESIAKARGWPIKA